jgi:ribosomal protein S27AE
MGRSYQFDCSKCGYRAKVAGRADRGLDFFVQTIACHDCKALFDMVTRLKVPDEEKEQGLLPPAFRRNKFFLFQRNTSVPPDFETVLNRLPYRVRAWNDPDKCPRCGVYMDRSALPYRIWE